MAGENELIEQLAFTFLTGMDVAHAQNLIERVGSLHQVMTLTSAELVALTKNQKFTAEARIKAFDRAEKEARFIADHNIKALFYTDEDYPMRLVESTGAPVMLYALGHCNLNASRVISVVGTRHATASGVRWVDDVIGELAASADDLLVVSGLAYGIDIASHRSSLQHNVPTAAVLAHGLSTLYPAQHRDTGAKMVREGGALLTDYPSDAVVHRGNFLARNRIVAGMCDCLMVVESAVKGGAMVTARIAFDNNREVLAMPGRPSDTYSAGCNRLIAMNKAQLVTSAEDILAIMNWPMRIDEGGQGALPLILDDVQQRIVDYISRSSDATTIDRISADLNISIAQLLPILVELDFNGVLLSLPGNRYRLA